MNLRRLALLVVVAATLVASACGSSTVAAATVNGRSIDRSEFERELEAIADNEELQAVGGDGLRGSGDQTVSAELSAGWLTAVIYDALITEEFERRELKVTADDREAAQAQLATQFGNPKVAGTFPEWFRDRLSGRNARARAVRTAVSGIDTSDEGIRTFYEENKGDFAKVCLSHILVETEKEATAVLARLKGGEKFAAVAKDVSTDPGSGPNGGDLDCNPKGVFVDEFEKAAFSTPLNQPSAPVQTQFGYHILLVRERPAVPFDDARRDAENVLNNRSEAAFREFLEDAARKADVTVDPRYGKFEAADGQSPRVVAPEPPDPAEGRPETEDGPGDNTTDPTG